MRVRLIGLSLCGLSLACLMGCADSGQAGSTLGRLGKSIGSVIAGPSESDIASALREALTQGTATAVTRLGKTDGFWKDPQARIPLPAFISRYESTVRAIGYGSTLDQFQLTMNRAAEQAAPQALEIFGQAIGDLTLADAKDILQGPNNAATEYFRRSTSALLQQRMQPIVAQATAQTGVTQQYKKLASKAGPILRLSGSSPPVDIDAYVTQYAIGALFIKIADEEARIRQNPAARSSELLRKVFGSSLAKSAP